MVTGKSNFRDRKKRPKPERASLSFSLFMGTMLLTIGLSGCYAFADWRITIEFTIVGYIGLVLIIAGLFHRFVASK